MTKTFVETCGFSATNDEALRKFIRDPTGPGPRTTMTRKQPKKPTEAEFTILAVIWDLGRPTVREVYAVLSERQDIGYTTVLKLMQIMTDKGLLLRDESERSHVYRARQKEAVTQKLLVKDLVSRAFGGSTEKLVMQALSSKKASAQEIADIRKLLDKMEGGAQ